MQNLPISFFAGRWRFTCDQNVFKVIWSVNKLKLTFNVKPHQIVIKFKLILNANRSNNIRRYQNPIERQIGARTKKKSSWITETAAAATTTTFYANWAFVWLVIICKRDEAVMLRMNQTQFTQYIIQSHSFTFSDYHFLTFFSQAFIISPFGTCHRNSRAREISALRTELRGNDMQTA